MIMHPSNLGKVICCIFVTLHCQAFEAPEDIQSVRHTIITTLEKAAPSSLPIFFSFSDQYEKLVYDFFDQENNEPYQAHISLMEKNMLIISQLIKSSEFVSVRRILTKLYPQLIELIQTLKSYQGSHNYIGLALSVRKFKYLVPDSVKKRGDIAIVWSLRHRLLVQ